MPLRLPNLCGQRTCIMGVLNVTPDSFFDKGRFFDSVKAIRHGIDMADDGADIIDVGGESTRPGAKDVSADEELSRVIPVIEALSKKTKTFISIDTRKAKVAEAAIKAGADIVNDISGLRYDERMASLIASKGVSVILMHIKGTPQDMQAHPVYKDVIKEISSYLKDSVSIAVKHGIKKDKIAIDPGIGFGKTVVHNCEILRRLGELKSLKLPICIGTSRKSFIGKIIDSDDPDDRLAGTLATCAVAIMNGASILRVHDVREALQTARVTDAIIKKRVN